MTTKPKTHKAPVAKTIAPKAAVKEVDGEPKREISEIHRLVSRWRWLEADQSYQASIAKTDKESERLIAVHNDEEREIERELATLIPETFEEVCCLLKFATDMAEQGGCMVEHAEIDMLRNVREGLSPAWRDGMKAAREEGVDEGHKDMLWTIHACDEITQRRRAEKEREAKTTVSTAA